MNRQWSLIRYIKIRGGAFLLASIAPISVAVCASTLLLPRQWHMPRPLVYYAAVETTFLAASCIYRTLYIQRPASHPELASAEQRSELFNKSTDTIEKHERYISMWHLNAPLAEIKRENVKEFFRWAFFNLSEDDPTYDGEVEDYVEQFEMRSRMHFEPGRGKAKSLRLTLDPVHALHRSLTWYMIVFAVDNITAVYLLMHGFRHRRQSVKRELIMIPPRPHNLLASRRSPAAYLSYWHRPHTASNKLPVIFLHGVGVGLWPYASFFRELNQGRSKEEGQIGVIAIELLQISSRLTSSILRKDEMCREIRTIVDYHGWDQFMVMTHSYGSVIATHLLRTPGVAPRLSSVLLVDPITILLSEPDVAYNFTVRKPKTAQEWVIWYFGSKDIGVAHTLGRHFFWQDNIIWKEDFKGHKTSVLLSSNDCIVNTPMVRSYLLDGSNDRRVGDGSSDDDTTSTRPKSPRAGSAVPAMYPRAGSPSVIWGNGLDHAQVFDFPVWRRVLKEETLKLAQRSSVASSSLLG